MQAADFLFGSAQPHDVQFEQLFRIFAAGNLGAAAASLAIKVCACLAAACTYQFVASNVHVFQQLKKCVQLDFCQQTQLSFFLTTELGVHCACLHATLLGTEQLPHKNFFVTAVRCQGR